MQSTEQRRASLVQRLDTSYTSFRSTNGMRSPRTPTYVPESPLTRALAPFDHAEFLDRSESRSAKRVGPPPPPPEPGAWIWTCHLCHSRYILGVTRRCLVDGHYYCAGETDRPSLRKRKKPKSCVSEFDYDAWRKWGEWRRKVLGAVENPRLLKGCNGCDYPSQCRSPVDAHTLAELVTVPESEQKGPSTSNTASRMSEGTEGGVSNSAGNPEKGMSRNPSNARSTSSGKSETVISSNQGVFVGKDLQIVLIPSLQEEMAREAARLQDLVGLDVWGDTKEVDLEKAKVD